MEVVTIVSSVSLAAIAIWKLLERHFKCHPKKTTGNHGKWLEEMASQIDDGTNSSQASSATRIPANQGRWLEEMASQIDDGTNSSQVGSPSRITGNQGQWLEEMAMKPENDSNSKKFDYSSTVSEDTERQIDQLIRQTRRTLTEDFDEYYNFAICGQTGVGKSTFINCIRGLLDTRNTVNSASPEIDPAPVRTHESVTKLQRYRWPEGYLSHMALWDVPASNRLATSTDTYCDDYKLNMFDCLLLLTSGRITQFDIAICKHAFRFRIPIILALTKADMSVATEQAFEENTLQRELNVEDKKQVSLQTIETLKNKASKELSRNGLPIANLPIFVIAPLQFRDMLLERLDQETGRWSSLQTYELLDECIRLAIKRRDATVASAVTRDDHQSASNAF